MWPHEVLSSLLKKECIRQNAQLCILYKCNIVHFLYLSQKGGKGYFLFLYCVIFYI